MQTTIGDLEWYFGQTAFERSTFGAVLERQQCRAYDSAGRRIPPPGPEHRHIVEPRVESGYEPDPDHLERFARVSRALMQIGAAHQAVLLEFYGNTGVRWASQQPGRGWALAALTAMGRSELRRMRAERSKKKQPEADFDPREILANEFFRASGIDDIRKARLARIRTQIDELQIAALAAWKVATGGAA